MWRGQPQPNPNNRPDGSTSTAAQLTGCYKWRREAKNKMQNVYSTVRSTTGLLLSTHSVLVGLNSQLN